MRALPFAATGLVLLVSTTGRADVSDRAGARAQLQQGYALKQQGKCDQAIPYFTESLRLSREAKGLLNLADCEEKVGKLASAQAHFVEARDLAGAQGLAPQKSLAEERLQALEKRIPRLVVKLAKAAPSDTVVTRDGIELGRLSLNTALPVDPGKHAVLARSGNLERRYEVTLSEAETKDVEVTPEGGQPLAVGSSSAVPPETPAGTTPSTTAIASSASSDTPTPTPPRVGARTAGLALVGLGVAGAAVGTIWGLRYGSKNSEIESVCPTGPACPDDTAYGQYLSLRDDAGSARTISIVGFAAGAVGLVSGAVVLLTQGSSSRASARNLYVAPTVGPGGAAMGLGGTW